MSTANQKVYAGTSAFFKNRAGNHNWLDNNARPMLNVVTTLPTGHRTYTDLFINNNAVDVKVTKTHVTLKFPIDCAVPLFRVLDRASGRTDA